VYGHHICVVAGVCQMGMSVPSVQSKETFSRHDTVAVQRGAGGRVRWKIEQSST
jgi:hypothetical protein